MIDIFVGAIIFSIWCITLFFGKSIGLSMFLFILFLGVAIALYILSELFREASKYKKENELTI